MEQAKMLERMFKGELTHGDLKAIGRSRGFSAQETAAPELSQHLFLSDRGVRESIGTLSPEEVGLLHLLNALGQPVGIGFFTRIDATGRSNLHSHRFNERYGALFRDVRKRLIQRGLLLCVTKAQESYRSKETILERKRFMFPPEFAPFLPPPCKVTAVTPGAVPIERLDILREKLAEITEPAPEHLRESAADEARLAFINGELSFGGKPFSVQLLRDWQTQRFMGKAPHGEAVEIAELSPPHVTLYALSCLQSDEWVAPNDLMPLWEMACRKKERELPDPLLVCQAGFECGCLEKAVVSEQALFRLAPTDEEECAPAPEDYLTCADEERVAVNLRRVPFGALELLARTSSMTVKKGRLTASPVLLKISHHSETFLRDPVFLWLCAHHAAFGRAVAAIEERRGKTMVHERLLIARVRDLCLKVKIEKSFSGGDEVVSLSDEFIAFPHNLLGAIEKLMKKSGHVVKTVNANDRIQS